MSAALLTHLWKEIVVPHMHIPDGFLSLPVALLFWVITVVVVLVAVRKTQQQLGERQIPLMGVMAAFIFAAQMINFPIAGGTSGHLLGGVLAAVMLGPWAGMLVMACVIIVQGLLFQDGGLWVMGANIFNMGLVTAALGGLYHGLATRQSKGVRLVVAGMLAWLSVVAGALFTALQLGFSGTSPFAIVVPAMLGIHALIGIGEGLITAAALAFVMQVRPDLVAVEAVRTGGGRGWVVAGLVIALIVVVLSPLASADPDGLERVAIDMGFEEIAATPPYELLPDYVIPILGETPLSTILAGVIGALVVALVAFIVGRLLHQRAAAA
ncbi:MAG: energy-coupling factor ABC transporter permease [Anaerolineae bacterium]|nr:energy-coupling factor ABC transporter permease [Anaerolineae bacterium]MDW8072122.1 energy-coupling factor ABC transporter permease [Anaerolineae bacterium]